MPYSPRYFAPVPRRTLPTYTADELRVAELVAQGQNDAEVAVELGINQPTVRRCLTGIMRKTDTNNRGKMVAALKADGVLRANGSASAF